MKVIKETGMTRIFPVLLIVLSFAFISGCLQDKNDKMQEITISAAVSLREALMEIGDEFQKKNPEVRIFFNFASSGTLERQIELGASVDVFASASQKEMDLLEEKGLILKGTRTNFTRNKLVIIAPSGLTIEDLKSSEVKKIAIGNPETVPAGRYARTLLENSGMYEELKPKFILAENVRQVLDYVERGEVDAGFVYFSDTKKSSETVSEINDTLYPPVVYPVGIINDSKKLEISKKFIEYMMSDEAQSILYRHGFN